MEGPSLFARRTRTIGMCSQGKACLGASRAGVWNVRAVEANPSISSGSSKPFLLAGERKVKREIS
jgi:hypothetical protein